MVAEALHDPPRVNGCELPVSFSAAPAQLQQIIHSLDAPPNLIICLGFHDGPGYLVETCAGKIYQNHPDNEGAFSKAIDSKEIGTLYTSLNTQKISYILSMGGASDVKISSDAGGYVCEWLYRHALEEGEKIGASAIFIHVPPIKEVRFEQQVKIIGTLISAINAGHNLINIYE